MRKTKTNSVKGKTMKFTFIMYGPIWQVIKAVLCARVGRIDRQFVAVYGIDTSAFGKARVRVGWVFPQVTMYGEGNEAMTPWDLAFAKSVIADM